MTGSADAVDEQPRVSGARDLEGPGQSATDGGRWALGGPLGTLKTDTGTATSLAALVALDVTSHTSLTATLTD